MAGRQPSSTGPSDQRIRLGDREYDFVTRQEIFAKSPKDLADDPYLNDPEAPDVSTLPISAIEEHPVSEGISGRPIVNLPTPSQQQQVPDVGQEPGSSKGKQNETVSDTTAVPVAPVAKWEPEKAIRNIGDKQYYVKIVQSIKRHIIAEGIDNIQETERAYKTAFSSVSELIPRANRRRLVFVAILRHSIGNFPKLCNPIVDTGRAASQRLASIIKYQASDGFDEATRIRVDDINSAVSDFCKIAYPYPHTGEAQSNKTRRFKFVCFNNFAFGLASQGLLTNLELPQRAIDAMMGDGELSESRCYNHESIFVVSRWLTTPLGAKLLEEGTQTRKQLPEIYKAIIEYTAKYMQWIDQDGRTEFKLHKITVSAAQAKIESIEPTLREGVKDNIKEFENVLNYAHEEVAKGIYGPGGKLKLIVDLAMTTRETSNDVTRRQLAQNLMVLVEECKPLLKRDSK